MRRPTPTQRYYARHRDEVLTKRRIAQQLRTVETDSVTLTLKQLAPMLGMPLTTLRNTWKKLVEAGTLPRPLPNWKRPKFDREKTVAWIKGERPEKPVVAAKPPRRAQSAANDLRNLMSGDTAA